MARGRDTALERLRHMLEATSSIASYTSRGRASFDDDAMTRDAILYQIVLGEAAKGALEADPRLEHELPDVEWSPIARMRDRVVHRYWATDREIVWATATQDVPALGRVIESALRRLA